MRALPFDRFLFAPTNRGLGASTNAGLAAARGRFVLKLEDDWRCTGPRDFLSRGVAILASHPNIGIVRFTSVFSGDGQMPPYDVPPWDGDVRIVRPDGGALFLYSNQPHLKSREFIDYIGRYSESRFMQHSEIDMRDRFNAQGRFSVCLIEGYDSFRHIGEQESHRRPIPAARVGAFLDRFRLSRPLAKQLRRLKKSIGRRG